MFSSRASHCANTVDMTDWAPGDVVLMNGTQTKRHYVYALLRDDGEPFYVGKTCRPAVRLRDHVLKGARPVREALARCTEPRMRILAGPLSERDALSAEQAMILLTPNLLNHHGVGRDIEKQRAVWRRKKQRQRARKR